MKPDGTPDFSSLSDEQLLGIFRQFQPIEHSLETLYVPFLPDYTPSIGDVDPFIKIPRPDAKQEPLGLVVLDEPCAAQSDATVLELRLQNTLKTVHTGITGGPSSLGRGPEVPQVRSIKHDKDAITKWINQITELHAKQGDGTFEYAETQPPDTLEQFFEPELQEVLNRVTLPPPDIDLSLYDYLRVLLVLLDMPLASNTIESLHMFFMHYMDVKDNLALQKK